MTTDKTVKLSEAERNLLGWIGAADGDARTVSQQNEPLAKKLANDGLISLWDMWPDGLCRYSITPAGRAILNGEKTND